MHSLFSLKKAILYIELFYSSFSSLLGPDTIFATVLREPASQVYPRNMCFCLFLKKNPFVVFLKFESMYEYYEWGKAGSKLAIYGGDGGMPFEARIETLKEEEFTKLF